MDLKIIMVEGPHDGAFISKVMQVNGYKTCKKPIGKYSPTFVAKYLSGQYKNAPVDELNLQSVRQQIVFPSYSLLRGEEEMMLIFQMGGDGRDDKRRKLVGDIFRFLRSSMTAEAVSDIGKITFVYEFDADEDGVEARLQEVTHEIRQIDESFPGITANGIYVESAGVRWGIYIFEDGSGKGRLEDIILPMMEQGNDDVAGYAKDFVDKRGTFKLFQTARPTSHPQKARVGVMGQLEKAGSANPAIIEQSSYLTEEKIKSSLVCCQIFEFFSA